MMSACGIIVAEFWLLIIGVGDKEYSYVVFMSILIVLTLVLVINHYRKGILNEFEKSGGEEKLDVIQSDISCYEKETPVESPFIFVSEGPKSTDLGISLEEAKLLYARLTEFQRIQEAFSTGLSEVSDKELETIMKRLFEYIKDEDKETEKWRWIVHG